jgi:HSP20 family protein
MANKGNIPVKSNESKASSEVSALKHPILEMEKAFDRFFGNSWGWPTAWHMHDFPTIEIEGTRLPKVDLIDRKNELLLRAELPGLDKKDVEVTLNDNILLVKGHTNTEKKEEEGEYHRHEIQSASFARSISVPSNIDASKIVATLKDGVLEVTLPKTNKSTKQTINVK